MRILFSFLLSIVFLQSQVYALSGGPIYRNGNSNSTINTIGTYAGVFLPSGADSNTIGIFTLGIPSIGLGQGAVYIFQTGSTFQGNIQGIGSGDDRNQFFGVIDAIRVTSILGDDNSVTVFYDATASGNLTSEIVNPGDRGALRIEGIASITVKYEAGTEENPNGNAPNSTSDYIIDGYKQSTAATLTSGKTNL